MAGYSPVYSAPFIQYTASTPNQSFLVPEGFTAVVRQISVAQEIADWYAYVNIQDSEAAPDLTIWLGVAAGAETYVAGEGRWVVPEGGLITLGYGTLGTIPSGYVGGYLLRNQLT